MLCWILCIFCCCINAIHSNSIERRYEKSENTVIMNIDGKTVPVILPVNEIPASLKKNIQTQSVKAINEYSQEILPDRGMMRDSSPNAISSSSSPQQTSPLLTNSSNPLPLPGQLLPDGNITTPIIQPLPNIPIPSIQPPSNIPISPIQPPSNISIPSNQSLANVPVPPIQPTLNLSIPSVQTPSNTAIPSIIQPPNNSVSSVQPSPNISSPTILPELPQNTKPAITDAQFPVSKEISSTILPSSETRPSPSLEPNNAQPSLPAGQVSHPQTEEHPNITSSTKPTSLPNSNIMVGIGWFPVFNHPFMPQLFSTNDIFGPIYPIFTANPMVVQYVASPTLYYMQVIQIIFSIVPTNMIPLSSMMDLSLAITNILRSNAESLSSVATEEPDESDMFYQRNNLDTVFRTKDGDIVDIPNPNDVTIQVQNAVQMYVDSVPEDVQNELTNALNENIAQLLKPLYQNIAYTRQLRIDDSKKISRREIPTLRRRSPVDPVSNVTSTNSSSTLSPTLEQNATPRAPGNVTTPNVSLIVNPTSSPAILPSTVNVSYSQQGIQLSNKTQSNDLITSILSAPNSVFQTVEGSILSLLPSPIKNVYSLMSTIATIYPNIQLSVLVGLATAITQIVARVLQMIASFVGIFAAFGKRRRDLSSDLPPSSLNMNQVLDDLQKSIKESVDTYVPEASKEIKNSLTSALYLNSLETINEAYKPLEDLIKQKNQPLQSFQQPSNLPVFGIDPVKTNLDLKPENSFGVQSGFKNKEQPNLFSNNNNFGQLEAQYANPNMYNLNNDLPNYSSNQNSDFSDVNHAEFQKQINLLDVFGFQNNQNTKPNGMWNKK